MGIEIGSIFPYSLLRTSDLTRGFAIRVCAARWSKDWNLLSCSFASPRAKLQMQSREIAAFAKAPARNH